MTRRARARWRRLVNRALREYRCNVPDGQKLAHRLMVQSRLHDPAIRAWALAWTRLPGA